VQIIQSKAIEVTCEQIFPTRAGDFYLEKFGIYCKTMVDGTAVKIIFDCSPITGGNVIRELTSRMMGVEFGVTRSDTNTLVVTLDVMQFKDIDRPARLNWRNEWVRR